MKRGAEIKGVEKVVNALRDKAAKARRDEKAVVSVGFTAKYAIFVHENLEQRLKGQPRPSGKGVYWGPRGEPKYLENSARQLGRKGGELFRIVATGIKRGLTMAQSLVMAGLRLQREAQMRVPVETGTLRASAFTRLER